MRGTFFLSTNDIEAALKFYAKEGAFGGHAPLAALWRDSLWDFRATERLSDADLVRRRAGSAGFCLLRCL